MDDGVGEGRADEVRRAGELLDAGRSGDAAGVLRAVLRRDDTDAAAWLLLSEARRRDGGRGGGSAGGDRQAAVQAARRAAALRPTSAAPRCALARALMLPGPRAPHGDPDAALAAAREAVEVDDHSVEALLLLADLLGSGPDPQRAAQLRERAARLDPDRVARAKPQQTGPQRAGPQRAGPQQAGPRRPAGTAGTAGTARLLVRRVTGWVVVPGLVLALALLALGAVTGRPVPAAAVLAALEVAVALAVVVLTVRGRQGGTGGVWAHVGPRAVVVQVVLLVLLTLLAAVTVVPPLLLGLSVVALAAGVALGVGRVRPRR